MLTDSLCRPLCGPLATALTAARTSAPAASGTVWGDTANCVLSNGDLTAGTTEYDAPYGGAKSNISHSAGKYVAKITLTYTGAPANFESIAGVSTEAWDPATEAYYGNTNLWMLFANGVYHHLVASADLGIPVASGEYMRVFVNFDTGKVWFGNQTSVSGDPEAGTGEAFSLAPNTALHLAAVMYSGDDATPVTATLDPTYSSGTFAAWG